MKAETYKDLKQRLDKMKSDLDNAIKIQKLVHELSDGSAIDKLMVTEADRMVIDMQRSYTLCKNLFNLIDSERITEDIKDKEENEKV